MKKVLCVALSLVMLLALAGCACEHEWMDADCVNPRTCECGETEGEALGHTLTEANFQQGILDRSERMPEKTKKRVSNTHMEIDVLCDYLRTLDLSQCREIHLLHLSDATSHEGHFINKVARSVPPGIAVTACRK